MLYGQGAGGGPRHAPSWATSSTPPITCARVRRGARATGPPDFRPIADLRCAYYVTIDVVDRPGVLAAVAAACSATTGSRSSRWSR